ncbi:heparin lyase I family protein [Alteromonas ponticola]|uniref:Polysaccharide lyase n=1 Tax=Alteromonas ponticola TaxID=2720613 RepID=A0ABX1R3G8_9ALTE|nr:heparin lyase I family protein [Alteromonas ponticola]NMH60196.1 hypothetical protein [Alteromonas ponticola]
MNHFSTIILILFSLTCISCVSAQTTPLYSITLDKQAKTKIRKREQCNGNISNGGGDLVEGKLQLRGKCDGAGVSPDIRVDQQGEQFIYFETNPDYNKKGRTRTELALTREWFEFKKPVYMGFKIKVPEDSDVTNEFYYLMQWWQCAPNSPIAGIRMDRGTSHNINFMTRGDTRSASTAKFELKPGEWHSFVVKGIVDPSGKESEFSVWHSPDTAPIVSKAAYGFQTKACKGTNDIPQRFRLKFGVYKATEPGKSHSVGYDDIRIGNTFEAVSPWQQNIK